MAIQANFEIGRPAALLIDRHGRILTAAFTPEPESWLAWRTRHGPELLVIRAIQFVTLLLALFVALKRPKDPIALVGSLLLATIGVFSVTLPFQFASRWRDLPPPVGWLLWLPFMSSAALAGWGLSFFTIFPRPRFRTRLAWLAIWVPLAPGLIGQAVFGYYMIVQRRPPPPLPPWTEVLMAVSIVYAIASVIVLVRNYGRLSDLNQRRRVRVLMLGMLIGSAGGIPVVVSVLARLDQRRWRVVPCVAAGDPRHVSISGPAAIVRLCHPAPSSLRYPRPDPAGVALRAGAPRADGAGSGSARRPRRRRAGARH